MVHRRAHGRATLNLAAFELGNRGTAAKGRRRGCARWQGLRFRSARGTIALTRPPSAASSSAHVRVSCSTAILEASLIGAVLAVAGAEGAGKLPTAVQMRQTPITRSHTRGPPQRDRDVRSVDNCGCAQPSEGIGLPHKHRSLDATGGKCRRERRIGMCISRLVPKISHSTCGSAPSADCAVMEGKRFRIYR